MLATSAERLPEGDDWAYEVKWDGYRTLALKEGRRVRLLSRNLSDATGLYPQVARAVEGLHADKALLDGEIVALDEHGRPAFQALHHQSAHAIVYYAFDILHLDGRDLLKTPLHERRSLEPDVLQGTGLCRSEPLPGTAEEIEGAVRALALEGVVAKRRTSVYEPGRRSHSWLKVRFNRRQELVVAGFKPKAPDFESLLVGYYEGRRLLFAGKVRAGLTPHVRAALFGRIAGETTVRCPFADLPNARKGRWGEGITEEDMAGLRWVKPKLVVEVSFVEWTRDGLLRHPAFVAIRTDKTAGRVTRDLAP
jgi:bifunctional non-homologous end joining protein LigD